MHYSKPKQKTARRANVRTSAPPTDLRGRMERMSGVDLSHVTIHYDSPEPAQLKAEAFSREGAIHLAPGREKHLAHEMWHSVQQKQGRVKTTTSAGGVAINDQPHLEREADQMSAQAKNGGGGMVGDVTNSAVPATTPTATSGAPAQLVKTVRINGEDVEKDDDWEPPEDHHMKLVGGKPTYATPSSKVGEKSGHPLEWMLRRPGVRDSVLKHLSLQDMAAVSQTSKSAHKSMKSPLGRIAPVSWLNHATKGPDTELEGPRGLESSERIAHLHAGKDEPAKIKRREKIDELAEKKLIVTRSLHKKHGPQIEKGTHIHAKGSGGTITDQVIGEKDTKYISAAEKPSNRFANGSAGHVLIKTPTFYDEQRILNRKYPHAMPPFAATPRSVSALKSSFIPHDTVMDKLAREGASDSNVGNARKVKEVMFDSTLATEHMALLDGGLYTKPQPKGRAALDREVKREAVKGAPKIGKKQRQIVLAHLANAKIAEPEKHLGAVTAMLGGAAAMKKSELRKHLSQTAPFSDPSELKNALGLGE